MMNWAVFLDRDGTINEEVNNLERPDQVRLLPGAAGAIRRLNKNKIPVIVITNQSDLAFGRSSERDLSEIHQELRHRLNEQGAHIDHIYHCPHHPKEKCSCHKPKPGLLLEAAETFQLDLQDSFMVGDELSDLRAGRRAGCQTVLVTIGQGSKVQLHAQMGVQPLADFVAPDLPGAVAWILEKKQVDKPAAVRKRKPLFNNEFLPIFLLGLLLLALIAIDLSLFPFTFLRLLLGFAYVLFAPGYCLTAALFPGQDDLDGIERTGLSLGLSIAWVSVLALILDYLPWGLRLWPIALGQMLSILIFSAVALIRRARQPAGEAYVPPRLQPRPWWWSLPTQEKRIYQLCAAALLLASLTLAWVFLVPSPDEFMTEFYILGEEGLAENYPREAAVNETLTVTMGLNNMERRDHTYQVEIWAVDPWENRRERVGEAGPFNLEVGEAAEQPISWSMPWSGDDQVVEFYLFAEGQEDGEPYRQLRLWLNTSE